MPISKENAKGYPPNWKEIVARIKERAGNKCEFCGLDNGVQGWRVADGTFYSVEAFSSSWIDPKHEDQLCKLVEKKAPITIVLTTAHLDHTPENCSDDNLKSLCQRCHLTYDAQHHARNARQTRQKKTKQLQLF